MIFKSSSLAAGVAVVLLSLASMVAAHPGEHLSARQIADEVGNAHVVHAINSRALESCQNNPEVKARRERAIARRAATFARLRQERGLEDGKFRPQFSPFFNKPNLHQTNTPFPSFSPQHPGFTEET